MDSQGVMAEMVLMENQENQEMMESLVLKGSQEREEEMDKMERRDLRGRKVSKDFLDWMVLLEEMEQMVYQWVVDETVIFYI